jgi:dihydrofolate reductase
VTISIIVAASREGVIGRENRLPWHLPRDLKQFRKLTMGKPIIMGRRTFESLGRPLDGRRNIVLSRDPDFRADGAEVVGSFADAIALAGRGDDGVPVDELMIIGGSAVFGEAVALADRVYLTTVEGEFAGDVHFPVEMVTGPEWALREKEDWPADAKNAHACCFATFERVRKWF